MKLATLKNGSRDGTLVVVSKDGSRLIAPEAPLNMQEVIERWDELLPQLRGLSEKLELGEGTSTREVDFAAPLPRAWQWLDGSAFETHGTLMQKAFGLEPLNNDAPLMYQGMSHQFLGPTEDVPFPDEAGGIDFEGEYGVIVDDVPMGISAEDAMQHIKLVVQINDWSLRAIAPKEMKTGFGWIVAKPACSLAPYAVTPDELGAAWEDGRVNLDLHIFWNENQFGRANGREMSVGFHELIAHAASTRSLCAGTVIGSGTVSNENYTEVGSSCISEVRGIEIIENGNPSTAFMKFGDQVRMETRMPDGTLLFGAIDQQVKQA